MRLRELPVIIVDCQTTGATPASGQVVDLAWARGTGVVIEAVQSTCVALPEGLDLPRATARITGLSPADLFGAPPEAQVAERLRVAVQGRVLVAHFSQFEQRFLGPWLGEGAQWICTHAIARRLLPDLPRRGLRAVAGHLGLSLGEHKRAAEHVDATVRVWAALLDQLAARGVHDRAKLAALLGEKPPAVKPARDRIYAVPRAERLGLPSGPGVYRMCDAEGRVLYVGKATDLKQRVNSYFRGRRGQGERKLELVTRAQHLDVTPCASPFEAALLEVEEIQRHTPQYNVALRARDRSLVWVDARLQPASAADETHRWGPVSAWGLLQGLGPVWRGESLAWPWPEGPDEATVEAGLAAWTERPRDVAQMVLRAAAERVRVGCVALDVGALAGLSAATEDHESAADLDVEVEPETEVEPAAGAKRRKTRKVPAPPPEPWTPERVVLALDRWVLAVGDGIRRAQGLARLLDAEVSYTTPMAVIRRVAFRGGRRVDLAGSVAANTASPDTGQSEGVAAGLISEISVFDRMAVLAGGLRDLQRQGRAVSLSLPDQPPVEGAALVALLAVL